MRYLQLALLLCASLPAGAQIPSDAWPLKAPVIPGTVKVTAGIKYAEHEATFIDVMQPREPAPGLRPAMIVIHGGGWLGGTRDWVAEWVCLRFVEKGFVVANVEYRLRDVARAPAAVEDVLRAARWFERHARDFGVDPKRIAVTGDSAGGHLALMVGLATRESGLGGPVKIRAVVNFFGITDVGDMLEGPNQRTYASDWVPPQTGRMALARRVSPLTYVRKGAPRILTIHGAADPSVPYSHAVRLTEALNAAGARAALVTVADGGHGFPRVQTDELYEQYVWPFLRSTGVYRSKRATGRPGHAKGVECAPESACGFAKVARQ